MNSILTITHFSIIFHSSVCCRFFQFPCTLKNLNFCKFFSRFVYFTWVGKCFIFQTQFHYYSVELSGIITEIFLQAKSYQEIKKVNRFLHVDFFPFKTMFCIYAICMLCMHRNFSFRFVFRNSKFSSSYLSSFPWATAFESSLRFFFFQFYFLNFLFFETFYFSTHPDILSHVWDLFSLKKFLLAKSSYRYTLLKSNL